MEPITGLEFVVQCAAKALRKSFQYYSWKS